MSDMKPILFNTAMVRAILEGSKTVTRRVVKPQPFSAPQMGKQPYRPGDILYVRETFATLLYPDCHTRYVYKATDTYPFGEVGVALFRWHPSVHMPKEAARLFLRVTDVRVQRARDITDGEAIEEGFESREEFISCFLKMYPNCTEDSWVWVIEFERTEKPPL